MRPLQLNLNDPVLLLVLVIMGERVALEVCPSARRRQRPLSQGFLYRVV
jgi:hypothetical protein